MAAAEATVVAHEQRMGAEGSVCRFMYAHVGERKREREEEEEEEEEGVWRAHVCARVCACVQCISIEPCLRTTCKGAHLEPVVCGVVNTLGLACLTQVDVGAHHAFEAEASEVGRPAAGALHIDVLEGGAVEYARVCADRGAGGVDSKKQV